MFHLILVVSYGHLGVLISFFEIFDHVYSIILCLYSFIVFICLKNESQRIGLIVTFPIYFIQHTKCTC